MRSRLINTLIESGLKVAVLLPRDKNFRSECELLERRGVAVYSAPFKRDKVALLSTIAYFFTFLYVCKKQNVDSILSFTLKPIMVCCFAGWALNVKNRVSVFTGLGESFAKILNFSGQRSKLMRHLLRFIFLFPTKVIVQNPDDFKLVSLYTLPHVKIKQVNGSGVDLDRFRCTALPGGSVRFLYAGRFKKNKGVMELLKASQLLAKENLPFCLILVGDQGDGINEISLADIGVYNIGQIEVYPFSEEIENFMKLSHVLVLPSYREGTPRFIIEGFATGRPCIVTDVPGCRQLITSAEVGVLTKPKDINSLVSAMRRFISEGDRIGLRSNACCELARSKFDDVAVNNDIKEFILQ